MYRIYQNPFHRKFLKNLSLRNSAVTSERPWKDVELFAGTDFLLRSAGWGRGVREEWGIRWEPRKKPLTVSRVEKMLPEPHSVGGRGERETPGFKKL